MVDARLLFSGSYARDGQDLIITSEDGVAATRLIGYFADATPSDLHAANGAILRGETVELLAGPRAPGQYAQAGGAATADPVGKVGQISGEATVQHADGTSETLAVETRVFQGDVLQTNADATLGVLFEDGTVLLLEPSSRIVVNEFVYDPNSSANSATLDAVDGTFAFVAGKVAKTGGLDVNTPIATMGIRGTTGLCVALDSTGARCSLAPDPNFDIGRIAIIDNLTGALFTTLAEIDVKLVRTSGILAVLDKTDQEIVFDELLVQQLHSLYASLDVPRSGPLLQKINDTGSPDFSIGVPGMGRGDINTLPLLLDTELDSPARLRQEIDSSPVGGPIGGASTIGNLDEAALDTGQDPLTGVLQFQSDRPGRVTFDFAAMHGKIALDGDGRQVTAGGVSLRFSWDDGSNTLTAFAGNLAVVTLLLDPVTGRYQVLLLSALDHQLPGADLLSISLAYTVTADDGTTGTGTLSIRFMDDLPVISLSASAVVVGEGNSITGNWSLTPGADGAGTVLVSVDGAAVSVPAQQSSGSGRALSLSNPDNELVFHLSEGTLVVRADGSWTFTAAANIGSRAVNGLSFSLTAVDGDGDAATRTVNIAIADGPGPKPGATISLSLDEKALDTGDVRAGDDLGSQPLLSTDHDSGRVSFTAGSDDLIAFVLDASRVVVLDEHGHPIAVTWVGTGTGTVIGQVNGVDAIRITVSNALIEAFSSGSVLVTAQLLDNLQHASDGSGSIRITGLAVVAKDIDGDSARSGVSVSISDDSASVSLSDSPASVVEGGLVAGRWNLVPGADGVEEITVSVSFGGQSRVLDLDQPGNRVSFQTPEGLLTVFADGSWTFRAATNLDSTQQQSTTFTLTVRDGDDDTDAVTDSQSIEVRDGVVAPTGGVFDPIAVEESDPFAPSSIESSTFSFKAGSDSLVGFAFDSAAIVVKDERGAALTLTWFAAGPGQIEGRIDGVAVIRLVLTASTIEALTSGNVTVTARLLSSFPHADGASGQVTISGIRIVGSEADGDSATATLSIAIRDDTPTANAGADLTVIETAGSTAGQNLLLNDVAGADGATVTAVNIGNGFQAIAATGTTTLTNSFGTYTFAANGSWTFDPNSNLSNAQGVSAGFTYRITDGDGDTSTAVQAITINDGAIALTPEPVALTLDEAALRTTGAAGSDPELTTEAGSASLSFTAGSDNLTGFAFSTDLGNLTSDLNGDGNTDIFWVRETGTQVKGYLDAGHTLLAVTLVLGATAPIAAGATGSVTVTATLSDNLRHALGNGAQLGSLGNIGVVAIDTDGDQTTGTVGIAVRDDTPTIGAFDSATIANEVGSVTGAFAFASGADGVDHFNITGPEVAGVTYSTATGSDANGLITTVLTASIDPDGNGTSPAITLYTLSVRGDGTYSFDLVTPEVVTTQVISFEGFDPGTPIATATTPDGSVFDGIQFSGDLPTDFSNPDSGGGSGGDYLKISENGFGLGAANSVPDNGGFLFHKADINSLTFFADLTSNVDSVAVSWAAYSGTTAPNGTSVPIAVSSTAIVLNADGSATIDPGLQFDWLVVRIDVVDGNANGGVRVQDFSYTHNVLPPDQQLDFVVSAVDADGDETSTSSLSIHVTADDGDGTFTLAGTSGSDTIGASTVLDVISGGSGFDTADYSDSTAAISINLDDNGNASGTPSDVANPENGSIGGGDAAGDSLVSIEGVRGGLAGDTIIGNTAANTLHGNSGDDVLAGEAGNDILSGGAGDDTIDGGAGLNTLTGGLGHDTFVIDASALAELDLVDVIADFSEGVDLIDLSNVFASLGISAADEAEAALGVTVSDGAAHIFVDGNGGADGGLHEVASLTGVGPGAVISILYDDSHPPIEAAA